jgi:hypothetical protein
MGIGVGQGVYDKYGDAVPQKALSRYNRKQKKTCSDRNFK